MCIDTNGNTVARSITADTANRGKTTTTPDNSGGPFPPCDVCPLDQLRYEWCLFTGAPGVAAVVQTMDTLYLAFFPLQHRDESPLGLENHSYEERPLVVATLWPWCVLISSRWLTNAWLVFAKNTRSFSAVLGIQMLLVVSSCHPTRRLRQMSRSAVALPAFFERYRQFQNHLPVVSPETRCSSTTTPRRRRSLDLCTQENILILFFRWHPSLCRAVMKRSSNKTAGLGGGLS